MFARFNYIVNFCRNMISVLPVPPTTKTDEDWIPLDHPLKSFSS